MCYTTLRSFKSHTVVSNQYRDIPELFLNCSWEKSAEPKSREDEKIWMPHVLNMMFSTLTSPPQKLWLITFLHTLRAYSFINIIDVMDVNPAAVLIPWGHIGDHRQTALGTSRLSLVPGQWNFSSNPVSDRSTFQTERRWEK